MQLFYTETQLAEAYLSNHCVAWKVLVFDFYLIKYMLHTTHTFLSTNCAYGMVCNFCLCS